MKFASAAIRQLDTARAAQELIGELERQLGGGDRPPDLVLFFATPPHAQSAGVTVASFQEAWPDAALLGTTAARILHPTSSRVNRPTLAALAAWLPDVAVVPFRMRLDDFERPPICIEKWQGLLEATSDPGLVIVIADPFTTPTAEILESLEMVAPGIPAVGALASGAKRPGGHVLALNDTLHRSGLIGVSLAGNLRADVLVSQGYRPVGRFFQVTRAEGNVVLELSGVPALEALEQMVSGLDRDEQVLLRRGLMLGEAVSEPEEELGRGDFLIRPVVGLDHEEGAISVAGLVDEGCRIRFQVWDNTLVDDLQLLLLPQMADSQAAGGLLFGSWPGRKPAPGLRFSVGEIQSTLGYPLPLAGFRGSGEIGPLHGANHLHTHTATLALIRPALPSHAVVN
ncbi:MAG: FIST C-terminal domain-containing protein [Candidatus Eisenbacteria sp.]|nr:FIST C-terminal domain-containing protein [Candidatus Eisenbacteria bacterium]